MAKKKPTSKETQLASSIYHELHYKGMLTPEQDKMLEDATEVLTDAGLVDENGKWLDPNEE